MNKKRIGIIGLGYVGLPLAHLFGTKYSVVGFDINETRVSELQNSIDSTLEVDSNDLKNVIKQKPNSKTGLFCTTNSKDLRDCNVYIITVPTPIDKNNKPDLSFILKSSAVVGNILKEKDIVIYESTVYPGVTEDECVPILEQLSGLKFNTDFYAGYSPERINPGDKEHTIDKILKITSGSTKEIAEIIDNLYASVITAGTYLASSIKVAEAAKVIENAQRDINIAFVNELAKIFNLIGIDTQEVLKAAATKWNFLPFKPGLVGGHCIGIDPYYLAHKAQELGHHPEIILTGRRVNDSMGEYVASKVVKMMIKNNIIIQKANVLMLGITFKENCPDIRNTKAVDLIMHLKEYGLNVDIYDTWANPSEVLNYYNLISMNELPSQNKYDTIILGVAHKEYINLNFNSILKPNGVIYDVKGILSKIADERL